MTQRLSAASNRWGAFLGWTIAALIGVSEIAPSIAVQTAPGADEAQFLADLRKPVDLVKYAAPQPREHQPLTLEDQADLIEAKTTMVKFLKSFSTFDPDPLSFLTVSLRSQYKSGQDLYAQRFGAEKLIEVEVYDFALPDAKRKDLALYVVLTDTTEGIDTRQPTAFSFRKQDGRWLIAGIGREVGFP